MRRNIIGICGRAGAGKDTVAHFGVDLLTSYGKAGVKIACADPLKAICSQIYGKAFGVDPKAFFGTQDDKNAPIEGIPGWTGRKILQYIGTEGFRHVHDEVWTKLMIYNALDLLEEKAADVVFISDVRFVTEANAVKGFGGIIIRVDRPGEDFTTNQGLAGHASENQLHGITPDFVINNQNRSLELLRECVKDMLCDLNLLPLT